MSTLGNISKCLAKFYFQGSEIDWLRFYRPYSSSFQLLTPSTYAWVLRGFWITYTEEGGGVCGSLAANSRLSPKQISTSSQSMTAKVSTGNGPELTFKALIANLEMNAVIEGHQTRDMEICPASAFCDAAATAAKHVCEAIRTIGDLKQPALTIRNLPLQHPLRKTLRKTVNGSSE
ncbi:beta-ketoacyl synthase domain-containing protein [Colletotrichum chrysophilum]|uniref:Beta-ketoacyl synthase domain-containing protein n=1 Tax=Colletotrichum chrysophilum TaxID=1836956 RepID=A0AAD9EBQ1_9PEZI|nr:beta-ketoacyl synthase domain-containing protein [Colletotrichum chrysophilum]